MATYSVTNTIPGGNREVLFEGLSVNSTSATLIALTNGNGLRIRLVGTGFTFDGAGVWTGGTVSIVRIFAADNTTLLSEFTGVSAAAAALHGVMIGPGAIWQSVWNLLLPGNDTINGRANGSNSAEYFRAGAGNDVINANDGNDFINAGPGNDTINGGAGSDFIAFLSAPGEYPGFTYSAVNINLANTTITDAWGFTDTISNIENVRGTSLNDTLTGTSADNRFQGMDGADSIDGGGGFDTVDYSDDAEFDGAGAVTVNLETGTATDGYGATDTLLNIEAVVATDGNDSLVGNALDNDFYGLAGDDTILGGGGFEYIEPGAGNDSVNGGPDTANEVSYADYTGSNGVTIAMQFGTYTVTDPWGNTDTLTNILGIRGTRNNDSITGTAGNDTIYGLVGNDTLDGGNGTGDWIRYSRDGVGGRTVGVSINLASNTATDAFGGNDTISGFENIRATSFADTLTGSDGNNLFQGLGGADVINGGLGVDEIDFSRDQREGGGSGVEVNLAAGTARDGFGATDSVTGIENVTGTAFNDTIVGDGANNTLFGGSGNDSLAGGRGLDFFTPGAGNDTIDGSNTGAPDQAGNDQDTVNFNFGGISAAVNVNFNTNTATFAVNGSPFTLTLIDVERVRGTSFADTFRGSDTANLRQERFQGLAGADTIDGGAGFDFVRHDSDSLAIGQTIGITARLDLGTVVDGFGATDSIIGIEGVIGTSIADLVVGNADRNVLRFLDGADTFNGGGGIDVLDGYFDDRIGGTGIVVELWANRAFSLTGAQLQLSSVEDISGSYRNDTLVGDAGANQIAGDYGNDLIFGGGGDDIIALSAGQDTADGEAGFDIVRYNYDPFAIQDDAATAPQVEAFFGWLLQNWNWGGVNVNLQTGTAIGPDGQTDTLIAIEGVVGTFFNDTLIGSGGDNAFWGLAGNDSISGGGGIDTVHYNLWTNGDRLELYARINGVTTTIHNGVVVNLLTGQVNDGAGGTDTLAGIENVWATEGNDDVFGNGDANVLILLGGNDTANGAGGDDILAGWLGNDLFFGGAGNDRLFGEQDNDTLIGEDGLDTLGGGDGNDILYGWFGNDVLFGDAGDDQLFGEQDDDVLVADIGNDTAFGGDGNDLAFGWFGADVLWGGAGNDQLFGEQDNDVLIGEDGFDTIFGGEGNDSAYGWLGVDVIWGGDGADALFGEQDNDVLLGEVGNDSLFGGEGNDSLYGWVGNDSLFGWTGNDLLLGEDGDDLLIGDAGNDTIDGGAGNDFLGGLDGNDFMLGFAGNDAFFGDDGNDFMGGLDGNDTMVAGRGSDTMWGDAGNDLFVFRAVDMVDGDIDLVNSFGEVVGNFDTIRFEGIAQSAVTLFQQGGDARITVDMGGGNLFIALVTNFSTGALADQLVFA